MKICLSLCAISIAVCFCVSATAQDTSFSVKDDIEMKRFTDPYPLHNDMASTLVTPSPDGKHFAFVTTMGLIERDLLESDVMVFDTDSVKAYVVRAKGGEPPIPRQVGRLQSFPHRSQPYPYASVIKDLQWAKDGKTLYFRGENLQGNYQLFESAVESRSMRAVTPPNISIDRFDLGQDRIAYRASEPAKESADSREWINPDAILATNHRLDELVFPSDMSRTAPESYFVGLLVRKNGVWQDHRTPGFHVREMPYLSFLFPFRLAPGRDQVITMAPTEDIPDSWESFVPAAGRELLRFKPHERDRVDPNESSRPNEYALVDLKTGKMRSLLDAPNARSLAYYGNNRVVWSQDGSSILLTNSFLKIEGQRDASLSNTYPCAVILYGIEQQQAACVQRIDATFLQDKLQIEEVKFGEGQDLVYLLLRDTQGQFELRSYRREKKSWLIESSTTSSNPPPGFDDALRGSATKNSIQLSVRQDLNLPPALWASDEISGASKPLWDPNPQLHHLRFGQASTYRWKDATGRVWEAGLIKPVGFTPGRRYPAVIQMYGFEDDMFLTDGTDPSAFAARHLASAGFIVLQIMKKPTTISLSDTETSLEGYRSAIRSLDAAGFIDANRVGVIGFSWTCWYVEDALVRDPYLFKAAIASDGLDHSFVEYQLASPGNFNVQNQEEKIYGGQPYGNDLKKWVDLAPGFQMAKVRAPLRLEANNPFGLLAEWELYSSLHNQGKPVDFIYFPDGTHIHQRPMERVESQQGSVDWFRFWLQGYSDPDPRKVSQYQRWERMKQEDLNR